MWGIILRELYDPNYIVHSPLSREEQLNVCFTTVCVIQEVISPIPSLSFGISHVPKNIVLFS